MNAKRIIKSIAGAVSAAAASLMLLTSSIPAYAADPINIGFGDFTNEYNASSVTAVIAAKKELTGRSLKADEFTFELKDQDGNTVSSAKNDADGNIRISVTLEKAGEYSYTVDEKAGVEEGMTYDAAAFPVTVSVTEKDDHSLSAEVKTEKDIVFKNSYTKPKGPTANAIIRASKTLTGKDLEDGEFTFELIDASGKTVKEVKNNGAGQIAFNMEYSQTGTYSYTIAEKREKETGIIYDSNVYPVTVKVTAVSDGTLSAAVSYGKDNKIPSFSNTYSSADADLSYKVRLEGRTMNAREFEFVVRNEAGDEISRARNDSQGNMSVPTQHYDKAGEYRYTIEQAMLDDPTVVYDTTVFTVTVTVKKAQSGTFTASVRYSSSPVFVNRVNTTASTTKYKSVKAKISAVKQLAGRDLSAGEFKFTLTAEKDSKVLDTVTNDAQGNVVWQDLTFYKPGVYSFFVAEAAGNNKNMVYDAAQYKVVVTVVADNSGNLKATVAGNNPTFRNTYIGESASDGSGTTSGVNRNSQTGDDNRYGIAVGLTVTGIGILLYFIIKKVINGD